MSQEPTVSQERTRRNESTGGRDPRPAAFTLLVLLVLVGPAAAAVLAPRELDRTTARAVEDVRDDVRLAVRAATVWPACPSDARQRRASAVRGSGGNDPGRYAWPPARAPDRIA